MKGRSEWWGISFAAVALLLTAGCGVNSTFVYKPGPPAAGGAKVPVKLAVLPFQDGTEDFVQSGSILSTDTRFNLAKGGIRTGITAIPPALWSKQFADEMTSSARFRSARFVFDPSEVADDDVLIDGTVTKAYLANGPVHPNRFALSLAGRRRGDNRVVWEKEVSREWHWSNDMYKGCGMGMQCMTDRFHAEVNKVMQTMFAEAGADLAATLAARSGSAGADGLPGIPPPAGVREQSRAGDGTAASVDDILRSVLGGK